jgi:hypothetical protein
MKRITTLLAIGVVGFFVGACGSNADVASDNISKEAEKFNVQRSIVGINGVTDKVLFEVEGRCSLESGDSMRGVLDVICKHGPDDYRKHYVGLSDNVTFISTQLEGIDVSEYRTKIILKPENLVPDFDLVTGDGPH